MSWHRSVLAAALTACAGSNDPDGAPKTPTEAPTSPQTTPQTTPVDTTPTSPPTTAPEHCVDLPPVGEVPVDEACRYACDLDTAWSAAQAEWSAVGDGFQLVMPAVGHLDDDDGDGTVGPGDVPDVAYSRFDAPRTLELWSGAGVLLADLPANTLHASLAAVAIADVDLDGGPEIVAVTGDWSAGHLVALTPTGEVRWTSEPFQFTDDAGAIYGGTCLPVVADLEGDGDVEVICGTMVVDGATGATVYQGPFEPDSRAATTTVADLDLDGVQETVRGGKVLDPSGTVLWQVAPLSTYYTTLFPAVAQLDADPEAEVLFANAGELMAYEHDGALKWTVAVGDGASPPCTGDLDGDGQIEIGVAAGTSLTAVEVDGTVAWSAEIGEGGASACAAFDFDRDGRAELIHTDGDGLHVVCGLDGVPVFEDEAAGMGSVYAYPVVADVDADGSAELVVAHAEPPLANGSAGVTVYGNDGVWPGTGQTWPGFDYRLTNETDAGEVVVGAPSWQAHNLVRSRPIVGDVVPPGPGTPRPDVALAVTDTCIADCATEGAELAVQVWNEGTADVPEGLKLEVRVITALGPEVVGEVDLPALPSGHAAAGVALALRAGRPAEVEVAIVDPDAEPDGTGGLLERECDDADNVVTLLDVCGG
jgi:hypothetical protein